MLQTTAPLKGSAQPSEALEADTLFRRLRLPERCFGNRLEHGIG